MVRMSAITGGGGMLAKLKQVNPTDGEEGNEGGPKKASGVLFKPAPETGLSKAALLSRVNKDKEKRESSNSSSSDTTTVQDFKSIHIPQ